MISAPRISVPLLRRSVLYLPASNLRAIEKARGLDCDAVILDLEDAVAPEEKDAAREAAVAAVRAGGFSAPVAIRVNGLDTPWGEDDLRAVCACGPDAALAPKIGDSGDIARYDGRLSRAPAQTELWAMVETARSLFHLDTIAAASKTSRLKALALGPNDLGRETGWRMTRERQPFFAALSLAAAAARTYGLTALDGPFSGLDDPAGFEAECLQGRDFGFHGKTLIHPSQVETANAAFSPQAEDVALAEAVVAAFAAPENAARGAIRVGGRMAERLHLAEAQRLLGLHAAVQARISRPVL